jgi:hypothetical protein
MPLPLSVGEKVKMKKKHPCGGDVFTLQRVGADIRASCDTCGSHIRMPRRDFEKRIKRIEGAEVEGIPDKGKEPEEGAD